MVLRALPIGCIAVLSVALGGCSGATATATPAPIIDPSGSPVAARTSTQPVPADQPTNGASTVRQNSTASAPAGGADAMRAIPCTARNVTLKPGGSNGDFNGMSHSGTYLILTNKSRNACSVPGLPQLTFLDANGPVKTEADLPGVKFMHPGPVVLPIVLQPKQSVATSARWVSGPVFQDNLCYKLTGVTVALREGAAMTPLAGQMCGERSKGVHYDLQRYKPGTPQ